MSKTSFTTSTPTATEVVQAFPVTESRSSPPIDRMNSSNSSGNNSAVGQEDDDLAGFMPDFTLMSMEQQQQQQQSPNDDEKSIGLASNTGRFNNDAFGSTSGAPTKTCMPGGFFWRSKVCTGNYVKCVFCVCVTIPCMNRKNTLLLFFVFLGCLTFVRRTRCKH